MRITRVSHVWRKMTNTRQGAMYFTEDDVIREEKLEAWWIGDNKGRFTLKSVFNNLRGRRMEQEWFASCTCINIEGLHLQKLIIPWWERKASNKLTQRLKAIPIYHNVGIMEKEECKKTWKGTFIQLNEPTVLDDNTSVD
ncbi:hypothetical protein H5410_021566 [Solanum commersonii]|uniref:Uncharacterized protein n=1 Tax=Solanum commersonii TaxID=4109 RepID=A0A9J5ZCY1_SOLCO|nr:hypothetical protein H5410_021566 [Solanum commersonii]